MKRVLMYWGSALVLVMVPYENSDDTWYGDGDDFGHGSTGGGHGYGGEDRFGCGYGSAGGWGDGCGDYHHGQY